MPGHAVGLALAVAAHRLDAGGNEDIAFARPDGMGRHPDGLQRRRAVSVDGRARRVEPREQRRDARQVVALLARRLRAAEQYVLDLVRIRARTFASTAFMTSRRQVVGARVDERALAGAPDGGAGRATITASGIGAPRGRTPFLPAGRVGGGLLEPFRVELRPSACSSMNVSTMRPSKCEPRSAGQQFERLGLREGEGTIRTGVRHAVVDVGNGQDPPDHRDVLFLERVGVPGSVPPLVVGAHAGGDGREAWRHRQEQGGADGRVAAHFHPLGLVEWPDLAEDRLRHGELAEVVEHPRPLERFEVVLDHAELGPDDRPEACDPSRVFGGAQVVRRDRAFKGREEVGMGQQGGVHRCPFRAVSRLTPPPFVLGASRASSRGFFGVDHLRRGARPARHVRRIVRSGARLPFSRRDGIPRTMRPSRRVLVLTVVAVACGALIVMVALIGIGTPRSRIDELAQRVLPASLALNQPGARADHSGVVHRRGQRRAPAQRAAIFAESQAAGTRSGSYWTVYQRYAFNQPAERKLQRRYTSLNDQIQAASLDVLSLLGSIDTSAYRAALAHQSDLSARVRDTIDELNRRFYQAKIKSARSATRGTRCLRTRRWILVVFGEWSAHGGLVELAILVLFRAKARRSEADETEVVLAARQNDSPTETELSGAGRKTRRNQTTSVIGSAPANATTGEPVGCLSPTRLPAHFRQVLSTDAEGPGPRCPVISPTSADGGVEWAGQGVLSSSRLGACPFLRERRRALLSACIPDEHRRHDNHRDPHHRSRRTATGHERDDRGSEPVMPKGRRSHRIPASARAQQRPRRVDVLTGLFNRRSVEAQVRPVIERNAAFVVAFADLDHFKNLNDQYGHEMGDRALRLFGRVLRDSVPPC